MSDSPRWTAECADALEWLRRQPTDSADLCVTSPPYTAARTYGIKAQRGPAAWVTWLRPIVVEMARVARLVALNVSDQVKDFRYGCGDLWLVSDLTRLDGLQLGPAPYAWSRPGMMGSGGPHYHRRNHEPVYVFARPDNLPPKWSDNTAFGKPPKYSPGGDCTNRKVDGKRVNQRVGGSACDVLIKKSHRAHDKQYSGDEIQHYRPPVIANPGNVIHTRSGGGQLGHELAHENEAPMNLALAERFVCWFCHPDGLTIDPFLGSGTTCHAAVKHRRRFAGCDVRQSQVDLCGRRMGTVVPELFA